MKLKDYAVEIARLAKKHPNALVVYSTDEEGNAFFEVQDDCLGIHGKFDRNAGEWDDEGSVYAVCIN